MFYVPGLLPPVLPKRHQKLPKKFTLSDSSAKESLMQKKLHEQVDNNEATEKLPSHAASERTGESVAQLELTSTENVEPPDITPSQAADVEMLLELAGEDDISNVSMDSQQMIATSGFCIDEQEEEDMVKCYTHPPPPFLCTFTLNSEKYDNINFVEAFVCFLVLAFNFDLCTKLFKKLHTPRLVESTCHQQSLCHECGWAQSCEHL